jgi:indole-3-glycerol phosphate synthase/phosphoribosylanthranilate isomerase/anthranilate synthase/indole-3-glycerol phosphate synthase/phosphoribosylanthranilate isomerase
MMTNILSEIIDRKREVVARLRVDRASQDFRQRALDVRKNAPTHCLLQALESEPQRLNIIAEFKRKSPSAGIISSDLSATEVARCYERGGACAISILTDEEYFGGSIFDLKAVRASTDLPIVRKDFIIDPIQIYEAAFAGADAVLLIAGALDDTALAKLRAIAEDELAMDALIEVHTSEELRRALNAGAKLIGVNNRDLQTFQVSVETSERLIAEAPRDRIMISESGLKTAKSLHHLQALGFRGFLIGEALMRAGDPETALRDLIAASETTAHSAVATRHSSLVRNSSFELRHFSVTPTQIKICGVTNVNDARICAELGADMIGFNFYPRSPRYVEPEIARQIVETLPSHADAVGVFVNGNAGEIRNSANAAGVRCVQLHGDFSPDVGRELAREFRVIQVFSTHPQFRPADVALFSHCDVLIDAHHPDLRGGTGQMCDWSAARETLPFARFLILSGGLNAENVAGAIKAVTPNAVDVCSGIESAPGVKNRDAIKDFIAAVRTAERSMAATSASQQ